MTPFAMCLMVKNLKISDRQEGRNWHGPDFAFAPSQFEAELEAIEVEK